MALKFLLRGGIYLIFGMVVLGQWIWKQVRTPSFHSNHVTIDEIDEESPETALTASDWQTRLWAVQTIHARQDDYGLAYLLPTLGDMIFDVREATVEAVASYGDRAVSVLTPMLDDEEANTREAVVHTLALIGNDDCMQQIVQVLQTDGNGWVRRAAAEALGQTHDPQYISMLSDALDAESVRHVHDAIYDALQQIGTEEANILLEKHDTNTDERDDESDYLIIGG